jgi:predicted O-methyltransferase YrrM
MAVLLDGRLHHTQRAAPVAVGDGDHLGDNGAMKRSAILKPTTDPTPLFELVRSSYATELLAAAVAHLGVFKSLAGGAKTFEELCAAIGLQRRPGVVLITALRAMGLIVKDALGRLAMSAMAREHLTPGGMFEVSDYVSLVAQSPGVVAMVERLRANRALGADEKAGAAFIFRKGIESAMEQEASARSLTLALCGRAKNVAPHLAANLPLQGAKTLLDVGGGTGIYAIALLQANPALRAVVMDRPEVLKVAAEFGEEHGVMDRLDLLPGDMFEDSMPRADAVLVSNILHDWDEPDCERLVARCAAAANPGGQVLIHDAYLNDDLDGPLPIALYSAALFTLTEGRAYSAAEYRKWLVINGLKPSSVRPTLVHCGVMAGVKTA